VFDIFSFLLYFSLSIRIVFIMESALDQIRDLYIKADAAERHRIQDQIRSLQDELYTDWEVLFGQAIGVSLPNPNPFPINQLT
jgi:hypothetical protein